MRTPRVNPHMCRRCWFLPTGGSRRSWICVWRHGLFWSDISAGSNRDVRCAMDPPQQIERPKPCSRVIAWPSESCAVVRINWKTWRKTNSQWKSVVMLWSSSIQMQFDLATVLLLMIFHKLTKFDYIFHALIEAQAMRHKGTHQRMGVWTTSRVQSGQTLSSVQGTTTAA